MQYPVVAEIPILVVEPYRFLQTQIDQLTFARRTSSKRLQSLRDSSIHLPQLALSRLQAVRQAELARLELLTGLLLPVATAAIDTQAKTAVSESLIEARRMGWSIDALVPFLLRDWAAIPERDEATRVVVRTLRSLFPAPEAITIAFSGCGAAGLAAAASQAGFDRIVAFDLSLPVLLLARHLLDGKTIELAFPDITNRVKLSGREDSSKAILTVMDAYETAFPDGSLDCVITAFLLDLLPDARPLVLEIHRILSDGGLWINYGPSGPREAPQRFTPDEIAALGESIGFCPVSSDWHRTTFLDITAYDPWSSFQSHVCYLTALRKTAAQPPLPAPRHIPEVIAQSIPAHQAGAKLIQEQILGSPGSRAVVLEFAGAEGQLQRFEIGSGAAAVFSYVDGSRTVAEVAQAFTRDHPLFDVDDTVSAFARYYEMGLLRWRTPAGSA